MKWLCWFVAHKWADALDESLQQCERCDKLRRKPPLMKHIPDGAYRCPYPECGKGYVLPPPYIFTNRDGQISWAKEYYASHGSCGGMLRWERDSGDSRWHLPEVSGATEPKVWGYTI